MVYSLLVIDVMEAIEQALRGLFGRLCILVYQLIGMFYNLFITISKVNVLSGNELVETLYSRVGLILGLFMVFKLMFSLIQALVDPDKLTDTKNGAVSIIKRSLIAIVLLGITPSLFKEAYDLQATLVGAKSSSDNILYKLIFAKDTAAYVDNFGNELAAEFYFSFFKDDEYPELTDEIENEDRFTSYTGDTIETLKKKVLSADKFSLDDTYQYLMMTSTGGQYVIEFSPLLCLGAGILILWIIITYCVQIAVRVFQLAYLQLIAPIPILSYISKPDGSFKKWTTQCTTTYLDLFLRLAIIYFVMAMVHSLSEVFENIDNSFFVELFLIIGLLQFAKKAPDLIKEIFPSAGGAAKFDFGLGSKPLKGLATFGAGAAIGAVGGAATGIRHGGDWKGRITGALGGLGRGALSAKTKGNVFSNARKGMANQRVASQKAYERRNDGSTWWGRNITPGDAARTKEAFDKELQAYKNYDNQVSIVDKELEKNAYVQQAMAEKEALMKSGTASAAQIQAANDKIKSYKESALQTEMAKMHSKDPTANIAISNALSEAEKIRSKGLEKGYAGFNDKNVSLDADAFNENKKLSRNETYEISSISGSRNAAYKEAEANAKYYKTK